MFGAKERELSQEFRSSFRHALLYARLPRISRRIFIFDGEPFRRYRNGHSFTKIPVCRRTFQGFFSKIEFIIVATPRAEPLSRLLSPFFPRQWNVSLEHARSHCHVFRTISIRVISFSLVPHWEAKFIVRRTKAIKYCSAAVYTPV